MRTAIFQAMSEGEGDRRLWFVVDELDALGAIDGLPDALARLRKFGGRVLLGFQSIAQVSGTYGEAAARTIVENCGSTLILRCSASEGGGTARFAAQLIGEREVLRLQTSTSHDAGSFGRGRRSSSASLQRCVEPAVLAAEIERLADLEGYLKLASGADWHRVRLVPAPLSSR
jgi:type IV secretory pathway TraG/TraD family ATPase VirD4